MVQYIDKFIDMCVVKVMPGEEKSQRRAVEHSGNKLKEVLTVLSVSIANTNPAASHTSISRDTEFKQCFGEGCSQGQCCQKYEQQGRCRLSASLKVNSWKSSTRFSV